MTFRLLIFFLIALRLLAKLALANLDSRNILKNKGKVPPSLKNILTAPLALKSSNYSLAKNRFSIVRTTSEHVLLALVMLVGAFPWLDAAVQQSLGQSDLARS